MHVNNSYSETIDGSKDRLFDLGDVSPMTKEVVLIAFNSNVILHLLDVSSG
jgi:hypothetical protein